MADATPGNGRANEASGGQEDGGSDLLGVGLFVYFVALILIVLALLLIPVLL